ncbi:MAG: hypothetical protein HQ559_14215 [Lentisphaerae bacterium]|nr:hypothetical protein [Lentisphaerota bacterium]
MTKTQRILVSIPTFLALLAFALPAQEETKPQPWLVLPARYAILQLGFDVASMRPLTLISYAAGKTADDPSMHVWDRAAREWTSISIGEYRSAQVPGPLASGIVLVGSDTDLPVAIADGSAWCDSVKRVQTLNIATILNSLNEELKFTAKEWKLLARRYRIKLKDLNRDRRRWGRYGKPGSRRLAPAPVMPTEDELTPEEIAPEERAPMPEPSPAGEPEKGVEPAAIAPEEPPVAEAPVAEPEQEEPEDDWGANEAAVDDDVAGEDK